VPLGRRAPPLTQRRVKDDALFERRADVECEIVGALSLEPANWLDHAPERGGWCDETRVHLIRCLRDREAPAILGALVNTTMKRAGKIIERWAQGYDETQLQVIADAVWIVIVERILAKEITRETEFLEVSFATAIKNLTLKEVAKAERRRDINLSPPAKTDEEGNVLDPVTAIRDDRPDPLAALIALEDQRPTLRELLRAVINRRHRHAFILHHIRKWPYQPGVPPQPCLCTKFGRSERQIRTWIGTALEQMRRAHGDRT
jgi:DNA-directed RNA polymerase specialized sigma24 family protein